MARTRETKDDLGEQEGGGVKKRWSKKELEERGAKARRRLRKEELQEGGRATRNWE